MITTTVVQDESGTTVLCKTFAFSDILSFQIEGGKTIKNIVPNFEIENEYIIIFTDDTSFTFASEKEVGHAEIDSDTLKVFVGDKILKQVETNRLYGSSVIDVIAGYKDDKPYSRFTYIEVDKPEEPIE